MRSLRCIVAAPMWLSCAFVLLMAAHMTADVVAKYLFNLPIDGTVETVAFYYMIGIVFLPIGWLELGDRQISVDLVYGLLPPAGRKALRVCAGLLGMTFLGLLAVRTGGDALRAISVGEIAMGEAALPIWPARCFLPIGLACGIAGIAISLLQELGLMPGADDA